MIRRFSSLAGPSLALLSLALLLSMPGLLFGAVMSGARAQDEADRVQAREHFTRGVTEYEAGAYQSALAAFQEAYRLAPHPTVRVNMANCYEHLDRPMEALHHFERFLAESENPSRQQRREVEAALRRLAQLVGEVRLAVAPDGATITIDNAETRRAPVLEPIRLTAGVHHVTVSMSGFRTVNQEVTVAGGSSERLSIQLQRDTGEPAVASADPVEATPADDDPDATEDGAATGEARAAAPPSDTEDTGGGFELRLTTPVIVAGSATAAFGVTAIITGVLALSANSDFDAAVIRAQTSSGAARAQAQADGLAAADLANTMSIVSDVFLIATIAAAGATAFFVIVSGMDTGIDVAAGEREDAVRLSVAPSASPDGGALMLLGQF